ncbi:hypothetical protein EBB05_22335 [Methylobacterium brachiatum]|nr:hypothetical protein EBB05_22335 [Methylobacterium brachiatum]
MGWLVKYPEEDMVVNDRSMWGEVDALPTEQILEVGRAGALDRRRRARAYLAQAHPALLSAYDAAAGRFAGLVRDIIEPAMRQAGRTAARQGWCYRVVHDDHGDAPTLPFTPGVRLLLARGPINWHAIDHIIAPAFVGFYGDVLAGAVRMQTDVAGGLTTGAPPRCMVRGLRYEEVSEAVVHEAVDGLLAELVGERAAERS